MANGKPQFLKNHFARIAETIKILKIQPSHFEYEQLTEEIEGLLKRNEIHEGGRMRITFYRKSKGFYLPKENDMDYFIEVEPIPHNHFELNETGKIIDIYTEVKKTPTDLRISKPSMHNCTSWHPFLLKKKIGTMP